PENRFAAIKLVQFGRIALSRPFGASAASKNSAPTVCSRPVIQLSTDPSLPPRGMAGPENGNRCGVGHGLVPRGSHSIAVMGAYTRVSPSRATRDGPTWLSWRVKPSIIPQAREFPVENEQAGRFDRMRVALSDDDRNVAGKLADRSAVETEAPITVFDDRRKEGEAAAGWRYSRTGVARTPISANVTVTDAIT
ncbi:MAG: hypothetical protein ACE5GT_04810, partial [Rhodospirillales bacterium]